MFGVNWILYPWTPTGKKYDLVFIVRIQLLVVLILRVHYS